MNCIACASINSFAVYASTDAVRCGQVLFINRRVIVTPVVGFIVARSERYYFNGTFKACANYRRRVYGDYGREICMGIFPCCGSLHLVAFIHRFGVDPKIKGKSPLIVGRERFYACGPFQAMQIYALSTASPFKGAVVAAVQTNRTLDVRTGCSVSTYDEKVYTQNDYVGEVIRTVLGLTCSAGALVRLSSKAYSAGRSAARKRDGTK